MGFYGDSMGFYSDSMGFYSDSMRFYGDSIRFYGDSMGLIVIQWDFNGIYHLVMTNSLPWKDPPFLSSVSQLFLWVIYTMAM